MLAPVRSAEPGQAPSRHRLVTTVDKDAYNSWTELQSALKGAAYEDACRIMSSLNENALKGLLPDPEDRDLFVSFPLILAQMMESYPALERTMNEKFALQANLRVHAAMDRKDRPALQLASWQFPGTQAAREAHVWLGDWALSLGKFREAEHHYRQTLAGANVSRDESLNARLVLAKALSGRVREMALPDFITNRSNQQKINLNGPTIDAKDFKAMIDDILGREPRNRQANETTDAEFPMGDYSLSPREKLELEDLAQSSPQTANGRLFFTRSQNSRQENQVVCVNLSNAETIWKSTHSLHPIGGPVIWDGQLVIATQTKLESEQFQVSVTWIDRETGSAVSSHPLFQLHESADVSQLVVRDWHAVVTAGGAVCRLTGNGEVQWLRRLTRSSGSDQAMTQYRSVAVCSDEMAVHAEIETEKVCGIDLNTGRTNWKVPVAKLRGLLAVDESTATLHTATNAVILNIKTGQVVAQIPIHASVQSAIDDGKLIALIQQTSEGQTANSRSRSIRWIDPKNGVERAISTLTLPDGEWAKIGPPFSGDGKWWVILESTKRKSTLCQLVRDEPQK